MIPCVLLMLQAGPRGTEELRELVAAFGFRGQAVGMDSTLQRLLDGDLVSRTNEPDGRPAARFALSAAGRQWLAVRSQALAEPARLVTRFLDRYTASALIAPAGGIEGSP
ncbi:MAG TPA: hypothetical protein VM324_08995 [Egibacteraceae bacterium]|nr:hypothetical protein [Egibacteraceae bacterium]